MQSVPAGRGNSATGSLPIHNLYKVDFLPKVFILDEDVFPRMSGQTDF